MTERQFHAGVSRSPFEFSPSGGPVLNIWIGRPQGDGVEYFSGASHGSSIWTRTQNVEAALPPSGFDLPEQAAKALYDALGYFFGGHTTPNAEALQDALALERKRVDKVLDRFLKDA